jgi:lysophospholipase L1-like esterase
MFGAFKKFGRMGSAAPGGVNNPTTLDTSGALAIWYMDEYVTTPTPRVPNSLATDTPTNYTTAPRRLFSSSAINKWTPRASFTDSSQPGPDGTNDASVFAPSGNFSAGQNGSYVLPAGTYTIACRAKRNTGTDQLFKMQFANAPMDTSATKTATDTWQWFTHTSARAGGTYDIYHMISNDGATGVNVLTMDWLLLPGTVTSDADLNAAALKALQGDMYLRDHTYSSGEVDLSAAGRYGVAQFPDTKTLTSFTAIALVSKTAAGSSYQSWLNKATDYAKFSAMLEESGFTQGYFATTSLGTSKRQVTLLNQGYHMLTFRYDDAVLSYFIDDCKIDQKTVSTGDATIQDLMTGLMNASSLYMGGKLAGALALYNRALTDAEVRTAYQVQKRRAALSGITATSARFLAADGDSITEAAAGYFYKYLPNASPMVQGRNYAVSGAGLAEVQSRASTIDAMLPPSPAAGKYVLTLFVGANLPVGSDMATFLTDYAAYCSARKAAGWKVAVCTILPRISDVSDSFNTRRHTINTAIAGWVSAGYCDAVIDFAADPDMGVDAAANGTGTWNATYYSDGVHPTAAGQTRLETIYRPVVNGLLV